MYRLLVLSWREAFFVLLGMNNLWTNTVLKEKVWRDE